MSDARTAILSRLRAAQQAVCLPDTSTAPRTLAPATASPEEMLERFKKELAGLGVDCHVEASAEGVRERVKALLAGTKVFSWDPEHLPYDVGTLLSDATFGRDARDRQAQAEMALTGVDGAIAETGSLVLLTGKGKARTVSLLPASMVTVVRRSDIFFSMGELFTKRAAQMDGKACCTIITGPSRTADIELQLTLGVHGPGKVTVVIGP